MVRFSHPRPGLERRLGWRFRPRLEALEGRLPPGDILALAGAGANAAAGVGASARAVNATGRLLLDGQPAEGLTLLAPASAQPTAEGLVSVPTGTPGYPSRAHEEAALPQFAHRRGSDEAFVVAQPAYSFLSGQEMAAPHANGLTYSGGAVGAAGVVPLGLGQWLWEGLAAANAPAGNAPAPLRFEPATGLLAVRAEANGAPVREAVSARGFVEVTLADQLHSSDPTAAAFDPALAGATSARLAGIRVDGGAGLSLEGQATAGRLDVRAAGPVTVRGNVTAAGAVVIAAPALSVRGTLRGASVDLAATGLVNVTAKGAVEAGRVGVTAGVFVNVGGVHADGVNGGAVAIHAGNVLNGGRITANGQASGGAVQVAFTGSYIDTAAALTAADGAAGGQVAIDGGATGRLFSGGTHEAAGWAASAGAVALRGKAVTVPTATSAFHLTDPHPTRDGTFGFSITPLDNGNVVVTNPHDDFVAPDSGAAYLLNGRTGSLLGMLVGGAANDRLGDAAGPGGNSPDGGPTGPVGDGVVQLTNGNYVVASPHWNNTHGAATWGNGDVGITGVVDASNSLVGNNADDGVGFGVTALSNGNYVVASPSWNGYRGAATWGDGTIGVIGAVDAANSLIGNPRERVSYGGITALRNGNYVVSSIEWNDYYGAVTWGDGTIGTTGTVDAGNSLVGSHEFDAVGSAVVALTNGNYLVASPNWGGGVTDGLGAATWGSGAGGTTGPVDAANSLIGGHPGDHVGSVYGVTALSNGNYVIISQDWNSHRGAATWGDGTIGVTGAVDASNSLVGGNPGEELGRSGVVPLSNGNYVVTDQLWGDGYGAVTWGDGTIGVTGPVNADNSLVGSTLGDQVGGTVTALGNGNYVISSLSWNGNRGAATWGNGTTGVTGPVNAGNSLVGSNPGDAVGFGIFGLSNGNYVVRSPVWNGTRGAATWGDGTAGVIGVVDATNSLVGGNPNDRVGGAGVVPLPNGNYVVSSPCWNNSGGCGFLFDHSGRGAVTWGDGTVGVSGVADASNSLVGGNPGDYVGNYVTPLGNGNYVVISTSWNGNRGAVTWGDGTSGVTGTVDGVNSLIGSNANDKLGEGGIKVLSNDNYVVASPSWSSRRGAATWGDGISGVTGTVDASNSLIGSNAGDRVAYSTYGVDGVAALNNGNYVVRSQYWNGNRGAATWGDGTVGITGAVQAANSLVGTNLSDQVGSGTAGFDGILPLSNGNYVVVSPHWSSDCGAVTWADGFFGAVIGPVDPNNSLVG